LTSIVCPLCGKHTPLGSFDPERQECDDIRYVEVSGLGKGKGFEVTARGSILDSEYDDTLQAIASRTLGIVKLLKDHEVISEEEIIEGLEIEGGKENIGELETKLDNTRQTASYLAAKIANVLEEDMIYRGYEEDDVLGRLPYGIEKLLNEYETLRAASDNEDQDS
jgi:hypothetical protein